MANLRPYINPDELSETERCDRIVELLVIGSLRLYQEQMQRPLHGSSPTIGLISPTEPEPSLVDLAGDRR